DTAGIKGQAKNALITNLEALAEHGRDMQHSDVVAHESDRLEPSNVFLTRLQGFLHKLSTATTH
ncbi:hypothetical protein, partial [Acidisphaera sp. L21]|uniref:hypothetical protein n=1 Tax=Acidisphaera sp. L21 TaxID=1641851 RepID=UPI001C209082